MFNPFLFFEPYAHFHKEVHSLVSVFQPTNSELTFILVAFASSCLLYAFPFHSFLVVSTWTCVLTIFLLPRLKQIENKQKIPPSTFVKGEII